MLLEKPAVELRIEMQDILEILEDILKQKNWTNFDVASLKLLYVPFYLFNYDALVETEIKGQPYSQSFSGLMAMNAVTGELEAILSDVLETQQTNQSKEIKHGLQYELLSPAISKEEIADAARVKMAGQFNLRKQDMAVSGFRLVYWPIWRIFVQLKDKTQRVDVDAVAGNPLNIEQVPTREKTWMEVTQETLEKLKKPEGWAEVGGKALGGAVSVTSKTAQASGGIFNWLFKTQAGIYTLIAIGALIMFLVFFS